MRDDFVHSECDEPDCYRCGAAIGAEYAFVDGQILCPKCGAQAGVNLIERLREMAKQCGDVDAGAWESTADDAADALEAMRAAVTDPAVREDTCAKWEDYDGYAVLNDFMHDLRARMDAILEGKQ